MPERKQLRLHPRSARRANRLVELHRGQFRRQARPSLQMQTRKAPVLRRTLHNSCTTRLLLRLHRVLAGKFLRASRGFVPFVSSIVFFPRGKIDHMAQQILMAYMRRDAPAYLQRRNGDQ